jgi:hypothetical protein
VAAGAALAHDSDANERRATLHRDRPGKSLGRNLSAEMDLHIAKMRGRQLDLRRVQQQARHAEPKFSLERVACAARKNANASARHRSAGPHGDAGCVHINRGDPLSRQHPNAGAIGFLRE